MKKYIWAAFFLLCSLLLISCARKPYPNYYTDYTRETWQREVATTPRYWTIGADNWFLTGEPNATELASRNAPPAAAVSTTIVNVSQFTNIKTNGDFQVQLFGTDGRNTVYLYGPNQLARAVMVSVNGNTLTIVQAKNAPRTMNRLIIRIGINQLNSLMQFGCGTVEGIQLRSNGLQVISAGRGNIYLAGNLVVRRIHQFNVGSITILGANTTSLDIRTEGLSGAVNVGGSFVGLRSIYHRCGATNINIIGAMPCNPVTIYSNGAGKIGINGRLNISKIEARGQTRVYAYRSESNAIYARLYDHARVGLAGYAGHLYVDAGDYARFDGRYLCVNDAYVRARYCAHINVSARDKIFASATQNSSVYFYGSPNVLSQFVSGNGVVMPIWGAGMNSCMVTRPVVYRPDYKGEHAYKGENLSQRTRYHWRNRRLSTYR